MLAGVLLALCLLAIEWSRADRRQLALRSALGLVAAAALTLLALTAGPDPAPHTAPPLARTIEGLDAPTEAEVGAAIAVSGRVTLAPPDSAWVRLSDPSGVVDSALLSNARPAFSLLARPRAEGGVVYRVTVGGAGAEAAESVGVAVRAARPPTVLVLDGSPSFETAYLKRWLSSRGATLALRTAVTTGRSRVERINGAPDAEGALTAGMLQRFDLAIVDSAALGSLAPAEAAALLAAVRDDGMGLLLAGTHSSAPPFSRFWLQPPDSAAVLDHRVTRPTWTGISHRSRAGIEVAPTPLRPRAGLEPLLRDERGAWLGAAEPLGAGRVAMSLVRTPSRWRLEGDDDLFAGYWSLLFAAVARDTATEIRIEGGRPLAGRRVDLSLLTPSSAPTLALVGTDGATTPIALARDPFEPRRWRGSFWPRGAGWQMLRLADRSVPLLVEAAPATLRSDAQPRDRPRAVTILAFVALVAALTALWVESRRRIGR